MTWGQQSDTPGLIRRRGKPMRRAADMKPSRISPGGQVKSTILLDPDTHDGLVAAAERRGVSFAQVVRELIELGLETESLGEADACG